MDSFTYMVCKCVSTNNKKNACFFVYQKPFLLSANMSAPNACSYHWSQFMRFWYLSCVKSFLMHAYAAI